MDVQMQGKDHATSRIARGGEENSKDTDGHKRAGLLEEIGSKACANLETSTLWL
jgi:hypothetical protein